MRALFKSKNLELGFLAPGLRSGAHPGSVAADYDQSFFGHGSKPLSKISSGVIFLAV
jgi:hypothetical protein